MRTAEIACRLLMKSSSHRFSRHVPVLARAWASTSHGNNSSKEATARFHYFPSVIFVAMSALSIGYAAGRYEEQDRRRHTYPDGLPRTCCDKDSNPNKLGKHEKTKLLMKLRKIVGKAQVLDGEIEDTSTLPFLKGARLGFGHAVAIVTPKSLQEVVDVVQAAVDSDCVVLPQGSNTGLTGGSVPHSQDNRPTVLISMKCLNRIFPLDGGHKVVCLAGAGLAQLQQFLAEEFPDRESHSVLGSTFLNPTTAAGVAFGSGGTQLRKGPAYTERALYLKVTTNKWKEKIVEVVDTLGIENMETEVVEKIRARKMDSIAYRLDRWSKLIAEGYCKDMRYSKTTGAGILPASDRDYARRLCLPSKDVSRYNADTRGPEPCRSEGKVIILATVHDTFPKPEDTKTFWLGFDSLDTALAFRREVALDNPNDLPISAEYMDRDAFDVVDRSGRILGLTIKLTGASSPMVARLWQVKQFIENLPLPGMDTVCDRFLHMFNGIFPATLPADVMETGKHMDHHVAMTVGEFGDGNMTRLLDRLQKFASEHGPQKIKIHEVAEKDVAGLAAFRFVAAPAFRTWCVGEKAQGFSVDYALPKNGGKSPDLMVGDANSDDATSTQEPLKRMRYSHFACNVVHEDVAYGPGVDIYAQKHALKHSVERVAGRLPAEHGHGCEYEAPLEAKTRWQNMDPLNVLNPGVGGLSEKACYKD